MATKLVRSPNNFVVTAVGVTLLLRAAFGAWRAMASNPYSIPVVQLVLVSCVRNTILGSALLFVALAKSKFTAVTATIAAAILLFGIALQAFVSVVFGLPFHLGWGNAVDPAIVAAILVPLLFPWSWSANRTVLLWVGLTFGTLTLLVGSLAFVARI